MPIRFDHSGNSKAVEPIFSARKLLKRLNLTKYYCKNIHKWWICRKENDRSRRGESRRIYLYSVVHREPRCSRRGRCTWRNQARYDTGRRIGYRFPGTRSRPRTLGSLQGWILRCRNTRNHLRCWCTFRCHICFVGTGTRCYPRNVYQSRPIRIQRGIRTGRSHQCWYSRH